MSEIRHIVFDIGRVLLAWDPERPYRTLIPDAARRRWFLDTVTTSAWNAEQDRGRPWAEAEALLIADYPEEEALIRAFRTHWAAMTPHLLAQTPQIMEGLVEAGHDVTMLTNFAPDTFQEALARFPVLRRPRGVTVSGEVGLIKPDPAIYALHAARFGLDPAATIFFDDSPDNIAAAAAAGWRAHLFTTPERMRADFAASGIAV
ncbi:HAD family phosphatase [Acuticoccus sp. I52.16.1]|uniref:HAD family hydrolase n=1 Tax=Acuticoccus sp. I52.16.1 TaxID=2928472 RepID=UPI001FD50E83|nr:HAD family phosphatase [Acuticoccus sp. I52.16.1]UOM35858.1 HAD family phosphatase [Acuticoccus sp. I52.16.1]